jgi:undecaprenyl-diphosphatase
MTFLHALLLGVLEGITEFLPISSTGHLILGSRLLGLKPTDFLKSFTVIIQLGAILAVVVLYAKILVKDRQMWLRVSAGFIPTAIVGLFFYDTIHSFLESALIVVIVLVGMGVVLIVADKLFAARARLEDSNQLSLVKTVIIGVIQSLAVVPGVSRSGATILGGMMLGLKRPAAAEFSFLLAVPTMVAASGLDVLKSGFIFSSREWLLLAVGFITAFISALLAVR